MLSQVSPYIEGYSRAQPSTQPRTTLQLILCFPSRPPPLKPLKKQLLERDVLLHSSPADGLNDDLGRKNQLLFDFSTCYRRVRYLWIGFALGIWALISNIPTIFFTAPCQTSDNSGFRVTFRKNPLVKNNLGPILTKSFLFCVTVSFFLFLMIEPTYFLVVNLQTGILIDLSQVS